ncbi:MAG: pantetheine-phosphate adenylyltransferase [Lachnospiraceae bacterium]|nr:pantetheine-phosphate adenylyltransferase [Lachnospiraceae bacterium]
MTKAVYPGSFDPVTLGHLDIIDRASKVVDELIIGILVNNKKEPTFTQEERLEMLKEVTKKYPNVSVQTFDGMTVDFAKKNGANVIVRGLRAVTDFESEMQIAQTNHSIDADIDTIFLTTSLEYAFLSSTIVKEVAYYGSDISKFVPECVANKLLEKFKH